MGGVGFDIGSFGNRRVAMGSPVFFVNEKIQTHERLIISGFDAHHIIKVLRFKAGDPITVSDGISSWGVGTIEVVDARNNVIYVKILEKDSIKDIEPAITLIQALPKGDKMDFILQKNTELGVCKFWPVHTERTVVELSGGKAERRRERWQTVVREASKQCGRVDIPEVSEPCNFDVALERARGCDLALIPWEKEKGLGLCEVLRAADKTNISSAAIIIGPEGGFSEDEIRRASDAGFLSVSLGTRILRTETAGIVLGSIIMYEFGGLGG